MAYYQPSGSPYYGSQPLRYEDLRPSIASNQASNSVVTNITSLCHRLDDEYKRVTNINSLDVTHFKEVLAQMNRYVSALETLVLCQEQEEVIQNTRRRGPREREEHVQVPGPVVERIERVVVDAQGRPVAETEAAGTDTNDQVLVGRPLTAADI